MDVPQHLSSLICELGIIRAKNIEFKPNSLLFVRCYLSSKNNNKVRLDSQEISSKSDLLWNQSFSLECSATQDSMDMLMQGSVVFELRRRSTAPILGKIGGSTLVGRAEIPWKTVSESPEMEIEKWVFMAGKSRNEDVKPPAVQVAMKVRVPAAAEETAPAMRRRRRRRNTDWDECGCTDAGCNSCADYEIFALAAALDAL